MAKIENKSNATIKLILWKQGGKKGYPIKVRITKNRKTTYINLKHYLSKSENKTFFPADELRKSYPKYTQVMNLYNQVLNDLNYNINEPQKIGVKNVLSFSDFLDEYLQLLEDRGQFGLKQKTQSVKYHLNNFTNNKQIKFSEIDSDFLERLQTYFIQENVSPITQKGYFDKLKSLLNRAVEKDRHYFKKHPFIGFKTLTFDPVRKNLDAGEFESIDTIEKDLDGIARIDKDHAYFFIKVDPVISESMFQNALKFKFQYYALGMRVSDLCVFRWSNIVARGSRINYTMRKTHHDLNFKISTKMYHILFHLLPDEYKIPIIKLASKHDSKIKQDGVIKTNVRLALIKITASEKADNFIFNMIPHFEVKEEYSTDEKKKQYKSIEVARHKYNRQLKDLQKKLKIKTNISSHVARHTFALNALVNKLLDVYQISKALNHQSVKTTEAYLRGFKSTQLDEGLRSFFDGKFKSRATKLEEEKNKVPIIMRNLTENEKKRTIEAFVV